MENSKKQKVVVAMSGGVDSSVAAALLSGYARSREARKKQDYDVIGVFMRFWADGKNENGCCSVEAEAAARLVAGKIGAPFYVWNFEKEFKKRVVDYFLRELLAGRTPNPCVVCNPQIKFGLFLDKAQKIGADYVATGHYARIPQNNAELLRLSAYSSAFFREKIKIKQNSDYLTAEPRRKLFKARDEVKDQSYFLYGLNQAQLSGVLFPLGDYKKSEVVKLAKTWRLPYRRGESFDVCFIDNYQQFLKRYLKLRPGKIVKINNAPRPPLNLRGGEPVDISAGEGELLGGHQGLPLYTIGQRAGLGGPGPFYVVGKNVKSNELVVSNKAKDLLRREMSVKGVNWLSGKPPKLPLSCGVRIRYQSRAVEAKISKQLTVNSKQQIRVRFRWPQRAITPGQSAVFYSKNGQVLGGGIILV